jgi:hypothetical protein
MMIERGDFTGVHEPFSHVAVFGNVEISGRPHPMLDTYLKYHLPFYQRLYQRRLVVLGGRAEHLRIMMH